MKKMSKEFEVLIKKVGHEPFHKKVDTSLETQQKLVGGYLDVVGLPMEIDMWVDDEGLVKGSPPNLILTMGEEITHCICGDVFFAGVNREGTSVSITKEQTFWILSHLKLYKYASVLEEKEDKPFPVLRQYPVMQLPYSLKG